MTSQPIHKRPSYTFSDQVIAEIHRAADQGLYEIRGFGANAKVLKEGNVVDVKTAKSSNGKQEVLKEIKLIKGELAK